MQAQVHRFHFFGVKERYFSLSNHANTTLIEFKKKIDCLLYFSPELQYIPRVTGTCQNELEKKNVGTDYILTNIPDRMYLCDYIPM